VADEFESMLADALAATERGPDRAFVMRVQAAVLLDDQLRAQRRLLAAALVRQLIAIAAIAATLWCFARAPAIASLTAESSAVALAVVLAAFAALAGLVSGENARGWRASAVS